MAFIPSPTLNKATLILGILAAGFLAFREILSAPPGLSAGQQRVLGEVNRQRLPTRSLATDPIEKDQIR